MRKQTISRSIKTSLVKFVRVEITPEGQAQAKEDTLIFAGELTMTDIHEAVKEKLPSGEMYKILSVDVEVKTYRMDLDNFVLMSEVVEPKTA